MWKKLEHIKQQRICQTKKKITFENSKTMAEKEKHSKKKKPSKKRSSKYQKKLTLHGMDEKEVLKKMLETLPEGKEEE